MDRRPVRTDKRRKKKRPPRSEGEHEDEDRGESKSTLVLKWFFLAMSIGLMFTTFLGIYMAFKFNRSRALLWTLLIAGRRDSGGADRNDDLARR